MAEIPNKLHSPVGATIPSGQSQSTTQVRTQATNVSTPHPGVLVNLNNQNAIPGQSDQPRRIVIDKTQMEQFLQRHPEVLQAMAQEMQQAASAGQTVPRSIPASQHGAQINRHAENEAVQNPPAVRGSIVQASKALVPLQNKIQRLVTIPNKTPPSSPYGIGEMNQASRVDITSLDTHAELYQSDFTIQPVARAVRGYHQASGAYAHQSSIKPIRLEKDAVRKNNPDAQRRLQSAQNIRAALNTALTAAHVVDGINLSKLTLPGIQVPNQIVSANPPTNSTGPAKANPLREDETIQQRKADILPFAEKYARSLGYSPEKGETEKILQDTVNFYGKSEALANTLKNLVNTLDTQ